MSNNPRLPVLRWKRDQRGLVANGWGSRFLIEKDGDRPFWRLIEIGRNNKEWLLGQHDRQCAAKDRAEDLYAAQMMEGFIGWDVRHGWMPNHPWYGNWWTICHRDPRSQGLPATEHVLMALLRSTEIQIDPWPGTAYARIPLTPGLREGPCLTAEVLRFRPGSQLHLGHCCVEYLYSDDVEGDIAARAGGQAYWLNADTAGGRLVLEPYVKPSLRTRSDPRSHSLLLSWRQSAGEDTAGESKGQAASILVDACGITPIGF